jgi:hypothetical protein
VEWVKGFERADVCLIQPSSQNSLAKTGEFHIAGNATEIRNIKELNTVKHN